MRSDWLADLDAADIAELFSFAAACLGDRISSRQRFAAPGVLDGDEDERTCPGG